MSAATVLAVSHEVVAVGHGALLGASGLLRVAGLPASTQEIPPEDQTSPGLLGFLVTFAVAAAVIALAFSLVRHLRVVDRNARRLAAEEAARAGGASVDADPTGTGTPASRPAGPGQTGSGPGRSGGAEPGPVEPGPAEPGGAEPGAVEPGAAEPGAAEPGAAEPGGAEPGSSGSGPAEPGGAEPGSSGSGPAEDHA